MARTRGKHELVPPKAAARTGGKRTAPIHKRPFGGAEAVLLFLCGGLLLLILVCTALPNWMGYTPYAISSDSMSPTLRRGDLAFVCEVRFDELAGGEIVVFETDTGLVTHRVYSVDGTGRSVRTKADASVYLDGYSVGEAALVGRVVYKLPLLGYVSLLPGGKGALG